MSNWRRDELDDTAERLSRPVVLIDPCELEPARRINEGLFAATARPFELRSGGSSETASAGIEVKAAATVVASDFRGLERLRNATDDAFALGVVLYDGDQIVPFGRRLFAAPFSCLWS